MCWLMSVVELKVSPLVKAIRPPPSCTAASSSRILPVTSLEVSL